MEQTINNWYSNYKLRFNEIENETDNEQFIVKVNTLIFDLIRNNKINYHDV